MDKLVLASGNRHKIAELESMLQPLGIEVISAIDYYDDGDDDEVEEDQPDLEGNALKKARFWHQKTGFPALADDTGLEVNALDGAPGVYSARYAGEDASYHDNVLKLLLELQDIDNRKARFRTVIALVGYRERIFEGVCDGEITHKPRGTGGFGYDPVFRPENFHKTFAEISTEEKNRISHRGLALKKVVDYLSQQV